MPNQYATFLRDVAGKRKKYAPFQEKTLLRTKNSFQLQVRRPRSGVTIKVRGDSTRGGGEETAEKQLFIQFIY